MLALIDMERSVPQTVRPRHGFPGAGASAAQFCGARHRPGARLVRNGPVAAVYWGRPASTNLARASSCSAEYAAPIGGMVSVALTLPFTIFSLIAA